MKTLLALLACVCTANLLYLNVAALLPQYVALYYPGFSSFAVGVLFSSYQVAFIAVAPFIGNHLSSFGRRRALFVAIWVYAISTAIFATAGFFENGYAFYFVSLVARSFQGVADAIVIITAPSIIQVEYPEKSEQY